MDKIIEKQISLSPAMLDIVKGKIVDVGSPVNFQTSIGNLNTMTGPMKENQLKEFFSNYIQQVGKQDNEANAKEVKFPSVSYYLDLDYWTRPDKEETSTELIKEIRNFSQAISEITDKIVKLVF